MFVHLGRTVTVEVAHPDQLVGLGMRAGAVAVGFVHRAVADVDLDVGQRAAAQCALIEAGFDDIKRGQGADDLSVAVSQGIQHHGVRSRRTGAFIQPVEQIDTFT